MCQECHDKALQDLQTLASHMIQSGLDMDSVIQACFRCGVYVLAGIERQGMKFKDEGENVVEPAEIVRLHTKDLVQGYEILQAQHELAQRANVPGGGVC